MSICNGEINSHVVYDTSKISKIIGGYFNDVISLECFGQKLGCLLKINGTNLALEADNFKSHGLIIDGLGGNDSITVSIPKNIQMMGVNILAKSGNNKILPQFSEPFSSSIIKLGDGNNDLYLRSSLDSASMIMGLRNMPNNKIHFLNTDNATFDSLSFSQDNYLKDLITVSLNSIPLVKILNGYSREEQALIAGAKLAISNGEDLPEEFIMSGLSLDGHILIEYSNYVDFFVFE